MEKDLKPEYIAAADLLDDVWRNINFDDMSQSRMRGIWGEFEGQTKALAKCYSRLEPFLDKLCARFKSNIWDYRTKEILVTVDEQRLLDIYRNETQIPMLVLRIRSQEKKKLREEQENAQSKLDI